MPDISPYGVTQNADADRVTANALVGDLLGSMTGNALVGQSAVGWSTAPYVPPGSSRSGQCQGKGGMCRAYPISGTDYCVFHTSKETGEPSAAP